MASHYRIDTEENLVWNTHEGEETVDDEIASLEKIAADPKYKKGMNAVCDFREGFVDWDLDDLNRFRAYLFGLSEITGECKWAVITRGGITDLTVRLFTALNETSDNCIQIKSFATERSALDWLKGVGVKNSAKS